MKKFSLYYFLFLISFFSFFASGAIDSQDGFQYLAVARNIYYQGEPTAPIYGYDDRKNIHMSTYVAGDGKTYSPTGLGYSLAYLPAVAFTDIVYKFYNIKPAVNFPLENDWLIFLTASFTNAVFAGILGVTLFLYLIELKLSKKTALFITFAGLICTNLFAYSKHSFPHMMVATFLFLSFFLIKKYFREKKNNLLIGSGAAFGVSAITYNQTILLSILPLGLYFLLLTNIGFHIKQIRKFFEGGQVKLLLSRILFFVIGLLPFIFAYLWFENLRSGSVQNLANPLSLASRGVAPFLDVPISVIFEGIYGQLFSPGRSIFLYSPILLLIVFNWYKIRKQVLPEVIVFLSLLTILILFYSSQRTFDLNNDGIEKGVAALWHGESSWGPRYLTPVIPFGILIVGSIFTALKKFQKILIFFPLLLIGFYIEILGVVMPYQIKFHDLQEKFYINATEYTNYAYSNLLPRYSPIIQMSKKLVKLYQTTPLTLDHGRYNLKFYDGIDFPFPVGEERWRVIDKKGIVTFDDNSDAPVKKITLGLINHPLKEASYSAIIKTSLNGVPLHKSDEIFKVGERKTIDLPIEGELVRAKNNTLNIDVEFLSNQKDLSSNTFSEYRDDPESYENKNVQPNKYTPQILGVISFKINDEEVNKESLDFPYISPLGPAMTTVNYQNYGNFENDPWKYWHIHTQIYERVPDFWWFKSLYYWDIPKTPIYILLTVFVVVWLVSGFKILKALSQKS